MSQFHQGLHIGEVTAIPWPWFTEQLAIFFSDGEEETEIKSEPVCTDQSSSTAKQTASTQHKKLTFILNNSHLHPYTLSSICFHSMKRWVRFWVSFYSEVHRLTRNQAPEVRVWTWCSLKRTASNLQVQILRIKKPNKNQNTGAFYSKERVLKSWGWCWGFIFPFFLGPAASYQVPRWGRKGQDFQPNLKWQTIFCLNTPTFTRLVF